MPITNLSGAPASPRVLLCLHMPGCSQSLHASCSISPSVELGLGAAGCPCSS